MHESTFNYLNPTDKQKKDMAVVRGKFMELVFGMDSFIPGGPDKTYLIRKLRECAMWANVAITRQPDGAPRSMNIEDRTELAWIAMDNIADMDTGRTQYAKAAAEGLGWIEIAKELPTLNDCVVCTDGKARWLDKRMDGFDESQMLKWCGHTATHWHPIADLPGLAVSRPAQNSEAK